MPKRTVKPRPSWPMAFAHEWDELADGQADVEDLLEKGHRLYRKSGKKDPRQVAAEDFKRSMVPRRELIPGFNAP